MNPSTTSNLGSSNLGSNLGGSNISSGTSSSGLGQGLQQLQQQQQQYGQGQGQGSLGMMPNKENVLFEQREFPPVVQETVIPQERKETQQVIHREIIHPEIHRVTQPYFERQVRPQVVQERELPPSFRETPSNMQIPQREVPQSTSQMAPVMEQVVEKPPIVLESIKRVVTTELQPVIYREVIEPHVIRQFQPMREQMVEQPTFQQARSINDLPGVLLPQHHQHAGFFGGHPQQQQQFWQQGQQGQHFIPHQHFPLQQQQQQQPFWQQGQQFLPANWQQQGQQFLQQQQPNWQQGQRFSQQLPNWQQQQQQPFSQQGQQFQQPNWQQGQQFLQQQQPNWQQGQQFPQQQQQPFLSSLDQLAHRRY